MSKKPFPLDVVPVMVGSRLRPMAVGVPVKCRDCGADAMVSLKAKAGAEAVSAEVGKPVVYLCHACVEMYDEPLVVVAAPDVGGSPGREANN